MKTVVCHTKFGLNPFGDGGSRRSVQIRELLANNGFLFEEDPFALPKKANKCQLFQWSIRAAKFVWKYYPLRRIRSLSDYVNLVKYFALRIPVIYDKYLHRDVVFLWENTNDKKLLYLMRATGKQVIGMPHNIESLVNNGSTQALRDEIEVLKGCDVVFAISKEETWLLRVLGINAYYLPYYPPHACASFLSSIRIKRKVRHSNARKQYLLLGSATNIPTKEGMQYLINCVKTFSPPFDLSVAGFGTEALQGGNPPGIKCWGTVSNETLGMLLYETDAVLLFQPPTTGALTRIPEMLLAGIPIFVNFDAGRNYLGLSSVHLYDSFEDLFDTLKRNDNFLTEPYVRDNMAESKFVNTMNKACE